MYDELKKRFAMRMRERRIELNYTQAELAEKLDLSKQAIWAWENKRREIGMCSLVRIALALEVSTDWLLGISDKKETTL